MVSFLIGKTRICVSFLFVVWVTLAALSDQNTLLFWSLFFSLLHEMGHLLTAVLCKAHVCKVAFRSFGVRIFLHTGTVLTLPQELFILCGGCLANLVCALLLKEDLRLINLSLCLFNALPIGALDGGRVVERLLVARWGARGSRAANWLSFCLLFPLAAAGFWAVLRLRQPSLLLVTAFLALLLVQKPTNLLQN